MDKNKIKLIVAIGVLVIAAAFLGYYFMGRSAVKSSNAELEQVPVEGGGSNRAMPRDAAKRGVK